MFALIKDNKIVSYSKTKIKWWVYTETEGLWWGVTIWKQTIVWKKEVVIWTKKVMVKDKKTIEKILETVDVYDLEIIITQEELTFIKNKEIVWIKEKYQNIIFEKYSLTDQLNMSNEAIQIMAFTQFEKRDFTVIEATRLTEIQDAKKWIDTQREACKTEINNLN